jgi:predicted nuclease of predicted toxin-antitoxin system
MTHDLDFSTVLAYTEARGPSVVQLRTQDVLPDAIGTGIVRLLREHGAARAQVMTVASAAVGEPMVLQ